MENLVVPLELVEDILKATVDASLAKAIMQRIKNEATLKNTKFAAEAAPKVKKQAYNATAEDEPIISEGSFEEHAVPQDEPNAAVLHHQAELESERAANMTELPEASEAVPEGDKKVKKGKKGKKDSTKEESGPLGTPVDISSLGAIQVPRGLELDDEKVKKEYMILLAAADADLPKDLTGWVIQVEEGMRSTKVVSRLEDVMVKYNASKKGQREPANSLGELFDLASGKFFTEEGIAIKTKLPVWCKGISN